MKRMYLYILLLHWGIYAQDTASSLIKFFQVAPSKETDLTALHEKVLEALKNNDHKAISNHFEALGKAKTYSYLTSPLAQMLFHNAVIYDAPDCIPVLGNHFNGLNKMYNLEFQDEKGYMPLHVAVDLNRLSCITGLLKYGVYQSAPVHKDNVFAPGDNQHKTPRSFAKSVDAIKLLLQHPKLENHLSRNAKKNRADEILRYRNGCKGSRLPDKDIVRALDFAVLGDNLEAIKALVAPLDAEKNHFYDQIEEQQTILDHLSSLIRLFKGHIKESTITFLEEFCAKNSKQLALDTELLAATREGNVARVQAVVQKGANLEVRGKDLITPLHIAAILTDTACLRILLSLGAQVDARIQVGTTGRLSTAYLIACESNRYDVVELLLEHGARYDAQVLLDRNENGDSALTFALKKGRYHDLFIAIARSCLITCRPSLEKVTEALKHLWSIIHTFGINNHLPPYVLLDIVHYHQPLDEPHPLREHLATITHYYLSSPPRDIYRVLLQDLMREGRASVLHKNREKFWKYMQVLLFHSIDDLVERLHFHADSLFGKIPIPFVNYGQNPSEEDTPDDQIKKKIKEHISSRLRSSGPTASYTPANSHS